MIATSAHIVIIGASHAGLSCAERLRTSGFGGQITILERDPGLPLQRPPLSKTYLSADAEAEDGFYLRPQSWFDSQNITLMTGTKAASIDTDNSQIHISDGQTIQYQKLVVDSFLCHELVPNFEPESANVPMVPCPIPN